MSPLSAHIYQFEIDFSCVYFFSSVRRVTVYWPYTVQYKVQVCLEKNTKSSFKYCYRKQISRLNLLPYYIAQLNFLFSLCSSTEFLSPRKQ